MEFCAYCQKEADGAMLSIGGALAHVGCAIDALNRLLDPDYDSNGEPDKIIGSLAGYVRLAENQSLPLAVRADYKDAQQDMIREGWRKVIKK